MKKQKKNILCNEYLEIIKNSPLVIIMHYNNLVNNYVDLESIKRVLISDVQRGFINTEDIPIVKIKVIKNSLIKHTIGQTIFKHLNPLFAGPTLLLYADKAPILLTHIIDRWKKNNSHLEILGGIFENSLISSSDFKELLHIQPKKEDVLFETVCLLEHSMNGFISVINQGPIHIQQTIRQYSEQK